MKNYDMSAIYILIKENVTMDALSRLSMLSVALVDDDRKELTRDVHILAQSGDRLVDSSKGGVMVNKGSE